MNPEPNPLPLEGCDAIQCALSEIADDGRPVSADITAHLVSCADCARFARLWIDGAGDRIQELERPAAVAVSPELRSKVMARIAPEGSIAPGNSSATVVHSSAIVNFPAPRPWAAWFERASRIAAVLAIGAFALWLLNPKPAKHPVAEHRGGAMKPENLVASVAAVEQPMNREKDALRHALASGGDELRNTIQSSLAVFRQ